MVDVHVPPVVELTEAGPRPALGIQLDCGHPQPHKPSEERLLHIGVLLEGHVLDHWRKLVASKGEEKRVGEGGGQEKEEIEITRKQEEWTI